MKKKSGTFFNFAILLTALASISLAITVTACNAKTGGAKSQPASGQTSSGGAAVSTASDAAPPAPAGGGNIPAELVGWWGAKEGWGDMDTSAFEIKADGTGRWGGKEASAPCSWSVSGDTLTLTVYSDKAAVQWSLQNGTLSLSNPTGSAQAVAGWSIYLDMPPWKGSFAKQK